MSNRSETTLNLKDADWDLFRTAIQLRAKEVDFEQSLDQAAQGLTDCISYAVSLAILEQTISQCSKPWWTPELRKLRQTMSRVYRRLYSESTRQGCPLTRDEKAEYLYAKNAYFQGVKTAKKDH